MRLFALLLAAGLCLAQETAPAPAGLVFSGKPLEIKPQCRPEDMTAAGLACSEDDPCELFLELTDVELVGPRLLLTGNLHTSSATLESVLLVSEDGGRTWTEPHPRIPNSGLDQVQFADFENGWISGQALLALPRDPFFLISSNGGKTWRKRPVFSETRVGMVESFFFEGKGAGTMLVDRLQSAENGMRYEMYQSQTGGDTWTLMEVSPKPLSLKRRKIPDPSLRIRPDAPTGTLRLERKAGERWQALTQFAVRAGNCLPPAPAALPEPPEPLPETPEPPSPPKRRR